MKTRWLKTSLIALAALTLCAASWLTLGYRQRRGSDQIVVLARGQFHQVAHRGAGEATIRQYPDGQRWLQLSNFATGAGSDLQVCLVAAADARENETVEKSGFVVLGPLKTQGDQSYLVPRQLDLHRYRAVTIWQQKHRVNFTTAPLRGP